MNFSLKKNFSFLICLVFLLTNNYSQTSRDSLVLLQSAVKNTNDWIEKNKLNETILRLPGQDTASMVFHQLGIGYYREKKLVKAYEATRKGIDLREKRTLIDSDNLCNSYRNIALFSQKLGLLNKAEYYYRLLAEKGKRIEDAINGQVGLFRVSEDKGDWIAVENHCKKLIDIGIKTKDTIAIIRGMNGASEAGFQQARTHADYVVALDDLLKITIFLDNIKSDTPRYCKYLMMLKIRQVAILKKLEQYEAAIDVYEDLADIITNSIGPNSYYHANILNNLGSIFEFQHNLSQALQYYQASLDLKQRINQKKYSSGYTTSLTNIAIIHAKLGNFNTAFNYFERSLINMNPDFSPKTKFENPRVDELKFFYQKEYFLEILKEKANALHAYSQQSPSALPHALQTLHTADALIDLMRYEQSELESKFFWREKTYPIYEKAIQIATELGDLEAAFYFMEKSKSILLLDLMEEKEVITSIPVEIRLKSIQFKQEINDLELQIFAFSNEEETETDLAELNAKLHKTQEAFDLFLDSLDANVREKLSPNQEKLAQNLAKLNDLNLTANQVLLSFFVGDSSIFIAKIEQEQQEIITIKKDFALDNWVDSLMLSIKSYDEDINDTASKNAKPTYLKYAPKLYQKLLGSINLPEGKEIFIIPDGVLSYLPFEILMTGVDTEFPIKEQLFLGYQYPIAYNFSATLWQEMKASKASKQGVLAVAPKFEICEGECSEDIRRRRAEGLCPLEFNLAETDSINQFFDTELWNTSFPLRDIIGNYSILHFATHSVLNDVNSDSSYLAVAANSKCDIEKLYVKNLYADSFSTNAQMVVLSACNTGLGELRRGEGLSSLAKGFAYSGTKSVVTSLWSVPDQSTADLMAKFYENLKAGQTKHVALWNARKFYLETEGDNVHQFPTYWAAFIPIGDMSPIENGFSVASFFKNQWLPFLLVIIIAALFFRKKRRGGRTIHGARCTDVQKSEMN